MSELQLFAILLGLVLTVLIACYFWFAPKSRTRITDDISESRKEDTNVENENGYPSTLTYVFAFLIGVILFWSFGKSWLNLESVAVFLAGLIGVALAVLAYDILNIRHNSHHKEN